VGDDAGRAYPGMDQAGEVAETAERDVNEGIGGAYAAFDPHCANCQLLRQEVGVAGCFYRREGGIGWRERKGRDRGRHTWLQVGKGLGLC
jgi:hypothetical protein